MNILKWFSPKPQPEPIMTNLLILKDHAKRIDALTELCRLQQDCIKGLQEQIRILAAQFTKL